jgi:hypothetical protein
MNANTAIIMFAVLAAFGVVAATLVVPIVPQAHAAGKPLFAPRCGQGCGQFNHPSGPPV